MPPAFCHHSGTNTAGVCLSWLIFPDVSFSAALNSIVNVDTSLMCVSSQKIGLCWLSHLRETGERERYCQDQILFEKPFVLPRAEKNHLSRDCSPVLWANTLLRSPRCFSWLCCHACSGWASCSRCSALCPSFALLTCAWVPGDTLPYPRQDSDKYLLPHSGF